MKFDRLMDFVTYALLVMIVISLVYAAVSILFQIRELDKDLEYWEKIEDMPYNQ